jgi:lipopolysaccharide/colanic/teichoic acid biosynthesis glycosyltransferase
MAVKTDQHELHHRYFEERGLSRRKVVEEKFGSDVIEYIESFSRIADPGMEIFLTTEYFNIDIINGNQIHTIANLKRLNDIADAHEFVAYINVKLPLNGYFIGCFEPSNLRKRRILKKYPKVLSYPYYLFDFILKRIFPKLKPTRKIYMLLTKGINRVITPTEALGLLAACGFEIVDHADIGYLSYFVARKIKEPVYEHSVNTGLIIKLKRVGKGGSLIKVYKVRTMHPYAEYLQDYVHGKNCLAEGCKFKNDFRITAWGRVMRKLWIDELPMFINFFRGEMKLVGVRPLSQQFFNLYPEEFQRRRVNYKPGLVPPFYYDLPVSFEEVVESERKYLDAFDKRPFMTDIRYFVVAAYNILIKRARSA